MATRGLVVVDDVPAEVAAEARQVYRHLGLACHVRLEMRELPFNFFIGANGVTFHPERGQPYAVWLTPGRDAANALATVVHELRHVWQSESGRLRFSAVGPEVRWHSGPWRRYKMAYEDAPWELDAFRFEVGWCRASGRPVNSNAEKWVETMVNSQSKEGR